MTDDEMNFEDGLARLEEIVAELEGGDVALDDAFERFQEGIALADDLRERLEGIEGRVEELLDDGALTVSEHGG